MAEYGRPKKIEKLQYSWIWIINIRNHVNVDEQIPLPPRNIGILGCIKTVMCPARVPICRSYLVFSLKEAWLTPGLKKGNYVSWCVLCLWGLYFTMCFGSIRISIIYHLICCRLLFTVSATLWVLSFISLTQAVLTGRQFWWKHTWTWGATRLHLCQLAFSISCF